jgi:hypothetical protein
MAITAVTNGSCSMAKVAPEDLEVELGEDDDVEFGVVMLITCAAGKSSQRVKVTKRVSGKIHTAAFLFYKLKGGLLVSSGAVCSEAAGRCLLEACTVADTAHVGAADVTDVSEIGKIKGLITHSEVQVLLARPIWVQARVQLSGVAAETPTAAINAKMKK